MNKKKGVTLIELLVVIAIIGFLSAISLPAYNTIKKKAAEKTLENKVTMLEVAAYNYGNDNKNDVATNPGNYYNVTIEDLIEEGYLSSDSEDGNFIINPLTGLSMTETVKITYENYRIKAQINNGASGYALVVLTDGGIWNGTSPQSLFTGGQTSINNPTKSNYTFNGWTINGAGSTLVGTTFTMGTANTTITANWTLTTFTLTVDANGGTWAGTTPQSLAHNQTATIANPSRSGYIFTGWTVNGTGSTIVGTTFTMGSGNTTITANWVSYGSMYTYNGISTVVDDGSGNWRIKLLTTGTTTFTPLINMIIDVFIVGGGGAGGVSADNGTKSGGGGGAGGYTGTYYSISLAANTPYTIVIGTGGIHSTAASGYGGTGGTTSAFGYSKAGGTGGYGYMGDANDHAGGTGGSNGGTGKCGTGYAGKSYGLAAQGSTTCEFEDGTTTSCTNGITYAYAGGGGGGGGNGGGGGAAGIAGAGAGAGVGGCNGGSGTANTGGGGGGAYSGGTCWGGDGGSGIVIIRNHQ